MSFALFVLLLVTFPLWFPIAAFIFVGVGTIWLVGYPLACTARMLYMRLRHGRQVSWHIRSAKQEGKPRCF